MSFGDDTLAPMNADEEKWRMYERDYILPLYKMAQDRGFDLQQLVMSNPGKNCVILFIEQTEREARALALRDVENAVGLYATKYMQSRTPRVEIANEILKAILALSSSHEEPMCPKCCGTGVFADLPCQICRGSGKKETQGHSHNDGPECDRE